MVCHNTSFIIMVMMTCHGGLAALALRWIVARDRGIDYQPPRPHFDGGSYSWFLADFYMVNIDSSGRCRSLSDKPVPLYLSVVWCFSFHFFFSCHFDAFRLMEAFMSHKLVVNASPCGDGCPVNSICQPGGHHRFISYLVMQTTFRQIPPKPLTDQVQFKGSWMHFTSSLPFLFSFWAHLLPDFHCLHSTCHSNKINGLREDLLPSLTGT